MENNTVIKNSLQFVFVLGFSIVMICGVIYSLYFGVTPTDEPFYISLPYRFALGDRPFIDEYHYIQTAGLFLLPFVKLYLYGKGSTAGIILFFRYVHLLTFSLLACFVYLVFRKYISKTTAVLLSLPCIVFTPFNIHSLSYNTQAILFLTAGLLLGFLAIESRNDNKDIKTDFLVFFSGIALVSAAISYPTLAAVLPFYIFCLWGYLPKVKSFFLFSVGAIIGGSWMLAILFHVGITQLLVAYHYVASAGVQGGGWEKIANKIQEYWDYFPQKSFLGLLLMVMLCLKNNKIISQVLLLVFITTLAISELGFPGYVGGMFFLTNMTLITPLIFFLVPLEKRRLAKKLLIMIWLPSLLVGLLISWSSSNGAINAVLGLFPGFLVNLFFMVLIFRDKVLVSIVLLGVIISLQYFNVKYVYGESASAVLNAKIESGPFQGIFTTKSGKEYYAQLEQDIRSVYQSDKRILFFDSFPAGYLFSNMRPATNSTWLTSTVYLPAVDRNSIISYYRQHQIKPDIIVKINSIPSLAPDLFYAESNDDPLNKMTNGYKLIIKRDGYEIFVV